MSELAARCARGVVAGYDRGQRFVDAILLGGSGSRAALRMVIIAAGSLAIIGVLVQASVMAPWSPEPEARVLRQICFVLAGVQHPAGNAFSL